ncbi:MAG: hypothetical protein AAFX62_02375 [Pseudomonadota bacterium]
MRSLMTFLAAAGLVGGLVLPALSDPAPKATPTLAERAIALDDLDAVARLTALSFIEQPLDALAETMPPLAEAWAATAPKHFSAELIYSDYVAIVAALDASVLTSVIAFGESDLGRRLHAAEMAMIDPEEAVDLLQIGTEAVARLETVNPRRLEQVHAIMDAIQMVETNAVALSRFNEAMTAGMLIALDRPVPVDDEELAQMCACLEEQLRPALVSAFESMMTAAYIGAIAGGSTSALVRRAEAFGQDLARELAKEDL